MLRLSVTVPPASGGGVLAVMSPVTALQRAGIRRGGLNDFSGRGKSISISSCCGWSGSITAEIRSRQPQQRREVCTAAAAARRLITVGSARGFPGGSRPAAVADAQGLPSQRPWRLLSRRLGARWFVASGTKLLAQDKGFVFSLVVLHPACCLPCPPKLDPPSSAPYEASALYCSQDRERWLPPSILPSTSC